MITMNNYRLVSVISGFLILFHACNSGSYTQEDKTSPQSVRTVLANELEKSLFEFIVDPWYPRNIDTSDGGYISDFNHDWILTESSQNKALVQQARHVWATSFLYENYPDKKEFLGYSSHGFRFIRDHMWDKDYGGFHTFCARDGTPDEGSINYKRIYGQAFVVYALSQYYRASHDPEALKLEKTAFLWMEEHAHDHEYGGYFQLLKRDGTPVMRTQKILNGPGDTASTGLKDYNSSIHLMEAFTELYRVSPDSLVRARLEEMFYLIRDTFVHPDGTLQLYFYPDWKLVPEEIMDKRSGGNNWFTQHITYGHDVETAYLLLETADVLGSGENDKTRQIAKRLVDHSLESGWDKQSGGFYYMGREVDGEIGIIDEQKSWWTQVEGLNALVLMYSLYPDDPQDYLALARKMWEYLDNYLIDKEHGGWYNAGLDITPGSKTQRKSHAWKTTYHNVRGMVNCIRVLKGEFE